MKKVMLVTFMMIASVAFASSMAIPFFVDNAPAGSRFPPNQGANASATGFCCLIYVHNSTDSTVECAIDYYNAAGAALPRTDGLGNTFTIPPLATIPFRPAMSDPAGSLSTTSWGGASTGTELYEGMMIPNMPGDTASPWDNNGSAVLSWAGSKTKVCGVITMALYNPVTTQTASYGYLFPDAIGVD